MDYEFSQEDKDFRNEIRQLIADNVSADYPGIFTEDPEPLRKSFAFATKLGQSGLLTRAWPEEFGGEDARLWSQLVFNEEMWAHNEPRGGQYMGVTWIGPALMMFGTADQQAKHLPLIASGTVQWCQGFSEPDAGSDLASLRLSAVKDGAGFRINGQKIWTSYSNYADYCVLAARTSSSGPKQAGITVFLLPMDRPGITVRPIESYLGPIHFNEVFFDDVFVADDEVLGEVDEGWRVMTAGLAFERVGVPRYARCDRTIAYVQRFLAEQGELERFASAIASVKVHALVARLFSYRLISMRENDEPLGIMPAIARLWTVQLDQEVNDVIMDALGTTALGAHDEFGDSPLSHVEHSWRFSRTSTIAAGALEIHKMLAGRALLSGSGNSGSADNTSLF